MRSRSWFAAALVTGVVLGTAAADCSGQPVAPAQAAQPTQPAPTAQAAPSEQPATFTAEQLEQLVAPIALYPDSLLTQTLMASTYPLEIVQAARWLEKNASLKDAALTEALKGQDWDPSVKSICGFPEVLKKMNDNLEWMQDLGDAFLAQQPAVLDAVQRMRAKAYESGNLKSTEQQNVSQSESVVIIEPANPEVIYVPTYSPTVVYGGWSYPSYYYPTMYLPPPPGVGFLTFTAGVAFGAAVWGHCDWGHHSVNVDVNRYNSFNRTTSVNAEHYANKAGSADKANWQHNAEHRKGVNYKDSATNTKYGGGSGQATRDQARGWSESRPQGGASAGTRDVQRPAGGASAGTRDVSRSPSGGASSRPTTSDRSYSSSGGSRNSAYSGSRSPSADTSASSRGASSRGTSSYSGSSASRSSSSASRPSSSGSRPSGGGGSRSGGGGGGRGGGGRR